MAAARSAERPWRRPRTRSMAATTAATATTPTTIPAIAPAPRPPEDPPPPPVTTTTRLLGAVAASVVTTSDTVTVGAAAASSDEDVRSVLDASANCGNRVGDRVSRAHSQPSRQRESPHEFSESRRRTWREISRATSSADSSGAPLLPRPLLPEPLPEPLPSLVGGSRIAKFTWTFVCSRRRRRTPDVTDDSGLTSTTTILECRRHGTHEVARGGG